MIALSSNEQECFRQIFEAIGTTNQYFVEIGFDGLFDKENIPLWHGIIIDKGNVVDLSKHVKIIQQFVTVENISQILTANDVPPQIDLFAIDIDGNDFHILREVLKHVEPRVIITEYNASFGPDQSIAIKYNPEFSRGAAGGRYHGASLAAFTKLLNGCGYVLVGTDYCGINAYFVKREAAAGKLRELSVQEAWRTHCGRGGTWQSQFNEMKDLEYEIV